MTHRPSTTLPAEPDGYSPARPRALALLATGSAIAGTGLGAGGTAGSLLGAQLAGTDAAAGLPLGGLVLGSAVAALLISRYAGRLGRGVGLASGFGVGAAGGALAVLAAVSGSLMTLLIASVLLGAANASLFLSRYAAATVSGRQAGGRAIGLVLFSTSIGAVASPLLLGPSGDLADSVGLPRLSGLYLVASVTFSLAGGAVLMATSPGARRELAAPEAARRTPPPWRALMTAACTAPASAGLAALALANFVMVAVMAVAPLHLMARGGDMEMTGTVIAAHVAGMFTPSPISGWLADKVSPGAVAGAGLLVLTGAGAAGLLIGDSAGVPVVIVLVVLGIGWNFAVVGASTLISRAGPVSLRAQVEGIGEVAMGIAAAVAAPTAGLLVAVAGMPSLFLLTAGLCTAGLLSGSLLRRQWPFLDRDKIVT